jgi:hypothetical protein
MKEAKRTVKRLKPKQTVTDDIDKELKKHRVTLKVVDESELPDLVPKNLFLFRPKISDARFCYVPCHKVVLEYAVAYFSAKKSDNGRLTFIVDDKKGTGVIEDDIRLEIVKGNIDEGLIEDEFFTKEQAEKKAVVDARWKVLLARYKKPPELEVISSEKFYRPYFEVTYTLGKKERKAWVPADKYATYFVYN